MADPTPANPAGKIGENGVVLVDTTTPEVKPPAEASDRPAWLPEKFKSPEEMAKAYGELEGKLGKPAAPAVEPAAPEVLTDKAKAAGVDMAALSQEYLTNGELSAESLAALSTKGFDKATVDSFIEGQKAVAQQLTANIAKAVGGEETMTKMLDWARVNLSTEEAAAFDQAVTSGNQGLAVLAAQGLASRYTAANGSEPTLVGGEGRTVATGVMPFESSAELTRAMSNPLYESDPAYRAKIEQRLAKTSMFGVS